MASVFGYAVVTRVIPLQEGRIAHVIYDKELNDKQCVIFNQELPLNTKLYWEYDCKEQKTRYIVMSDN